MTALATTTHTPASIVERVVIAGDLSRLTPEDRVRYYAEVCTSVGLNPLTKPFEYITLNGKLQLYALKAATDQLRKIYSVTITITNREHVEGVYCVTARAKTADGREDEDCGAVNTANLKGDALANAMMKAVTKAKRRVTLSICGLGMLDETEVETIPGAQPMPHVNVIDPPAPVAPPPLTDSQFVAEMITAAEARGATVDQAKTWLESSLEKNNLTLAGINDTQRRALIARMKDGKYDADLLPPKPAADDGWQATVDEFRLNAHELAALTPEDADAALQKWLRRVGFSKNPASLPPARRQELLKSQHDGRFNYETGAIAAAIPATANA